MKQDADLLKHEIRVSRLQSGFWNRPLALNVSHLWTGLHMTVFY